MTYNYGNTGFDYSAAKMMKRKEGIIDYGTPVAFESWSNKQWDLLAMVLLPMTVTGNNGSIYFVLLMKMQNIFIRKWESSHKIRVFSLLLFSLKFFIQKYIGIGSSFSNSGIPRDVDLCKKMVSSIRPCFVKTERGMD